MAWRPLGLVVFLTLAACSSPDDPPAVPSDPSLPGGGGTTPGAPGSGNSGSSDAGTSDAGTGTPSDGGIPNNDAGIPNNDAGIPNNDAGIPNNDAGIPNNDAGIPNNDAGFAASLQPEACVPWTGSQPPQEASPCEVTYQSGSQSTRKRYDSQGHLLEYRTSDDKGHVTRIETHVWSDGQEVLVREEHPDAWWNETVSTFNAQRQMSTRTERNSVNSEGLHTQYIYHADGRLDRIDQQQAGRQDKASLYVYTGGQLERIDNQEAGEVVSRTRYLYDTQGRLTDRFFLEWDGYSPFGSSFTYHPNDRVQQSHRYSQSSETTETYDSRGNLLRRDWNNYPEPGGDRSTSIAFLYDEANRVTWSEYLGNGMGGNSITTSRYQFNAQGQEELSWSVRQWIPSARDAEPPVLSTVRTTYLCDTALKHHVDTDSDGNGTVDARCTYARDARGALVREECFDLPVGAWKVTSTDYRYDCQ